MDTPTFRTRVARLVQKSRKALRLYSSMGRINPKEGDDYSALQLEEWKSINGELLQALTRAMEHTGTRTLAEEIYRLRDRYYDEWRTQEAGVHSGQRELVFAAENGDFVKSATLGRKLAGMKSRMQAAQAAHHELQEVIDRSKITRPESQTRTAPVENSQEEPSAPPVAKVIPMRRR